MLISAQIMTPENWDSVLEDGVQGAGWQGGAFLFTNFIFGRMLSFCKLF